MFIIYDTVTNHTFAKQKQGNDEKTIFIMEKRPSKIICATYDFLANKIH